MAISSPTIPMGTGIKSLRIVIQTNANYQDKRLIPIAGNSDIVLNLLDDFFSELQRGVYNSNIQIMASGVYATGTAVLASVVAGDTIVIGGVTLTADNSLQDTTHFKVGASNAATAANLVTTIGANTSLTRVVQASASSATVTIACLVPGTIGNLVTLSQTGGHITVGSALTGGTDGAIGTISHGL